MLEHAATLFRTVVESRADATDPLWLRAGRVRPGASRAAGPATAAAPATRVVAKLAEGKTVYGIQTGDLSLLRPRTARAPVDFVYVDMEHNPLDFPALHHVPDGHVRPRHGAQEGQPAAQRRAVRALPTRSDQSQWVVKQALDIGLHGIFFNGVDTKEQA